MFQTRQYQISLLDTAVSVKNLQAKLNFKFMYKINPMYVFISKLIKNNIITEDCQYLLNKYSKITPNIEPKGIKSELPKLYNNTYKLYCDYLDYCSLELSQKNPKKLFINKAYKYKSKYIKHKNTVSKWVLTESFHKLKEKKNFIYEPVVGQVKILRTRFFKKQWVYFTKKIHKLTDKISCRNKQYKGYMHLTLKHLPKIPNFIVKKYSNKNLKKKKIKKKKNKYYLKKKKYSKQYLRFKTNWLTIKRPTPVVREKQKIFVSDLINLKLKKSTALRQKHNFNLKNIIKLQKIAVKTNNYNLYQSLKQHFKLLKIQRSSPSIVLKKKQFNKNGFNFFLKKNKNKRLKLSKNMYIFTKFLNNLVSTNINSNWYKNLFFFSIYYKNIIKNFSFKVKNLKKFLTARKILIVKKVKYKIIKKKQNFKKFNSLKKTLYLLYKYLKNKNYLNISKNNNIHSISNKNHTFFTFYNNFSVLTKLLPNWRVSNYFNDNNPIFKETLRFKSVYRFVNNHKINLKKLNLKTFKNRNNNPILKVNSIFFKFKSLIKFLKLKTFNSRNLKNLNNYFTLKTVTSLLHSHPEQFLVYFKYFLAQFTNMQTPLTNSTDELVKNQILHLKKKLKNSRPIRLFDKKNSFINKFILKIFKRHLLRISRFKWLSKRKKKKFNKVRLLVLYHLAMPKILKIYSSKSPLQYQLNTTLNLLKKKYKLIMSKMCQISFIKKKTKKIKIYKLISSTYTNKFLNYKNSAYVTKHFNSCINLLKFYKKKKVLNKMTGVVDSSDSNLNKKILKYQKLKKITNKIVNYYCLKNIQLQKKKFSLNKYIVKQFKGIIKKSINFKINNKKAASTAKHINFDEFIGSIKKAIRQKDYYYINSRVKKLKKTIRKPIFKNPNLLLNKTQRSIRWEDKIFLKWTYFKYKHTVMNNSILFSKKLNATKYEKILKNKNFSKFFSKLFVFVDLFNMKKKKNDLNNFDFKFIKLLVGVGRYKLNSKVPSKLYWLLKKYNILKKFKKIYIKSKQIKYIKKKQLLTYITTYKKPKNAPVKYLSYRKSHIRSKIVTKYIKLKKWLERKSQHNRHLLDKKFKRLLKVGSITKVFRKEYSSRLREYYEKKITKEKYKKFLKQSKKKLNKVWFFLKKKKYFKKIFKKFNKTLKLKIKKFNTINNTNIKLSSVKLEIKKTTKYLKNLKPNLLKSNIKLKASKLTNKLLTNNRKFNLNRKVITKKIKKNSKFKKQKTLKNKSTNTKLKQKKNNNKITKLVKKKINLKKPKVLNNNKSLIIKKNSLKVIKLKNIKLLILKLNKKKIFINIIKLKKNINSTFNKSIKLLLIQFVKLLKKKKIKKQTKYTHHLINKKPIYRWILRNIKKTKLDLNPSKKLLILKNKKQNSNTRKKIKKLEIIQSLLPVKKKYNFNIKFNKAFKYKKFKKLLNSWNNFKFAEKIIALKYLKLRLLFSNISKINYISKSYKYKINLKNIKKKTVIKIKLKQKLNKKINLKKKIQFKSLESNAKKKKKKNTSKIRKYFFNNFLLQFKKLKIKLNKKLKKVKKIQLNKKLKKVKKVQSNKKILKKIKNKTPKNIHFRGKKTKIKLNKPNIKIEKLKPIETPINKKRLRSENFSYKKLKELKKLKSSMNYNNNLNNNNNNNNNNKNNNLNTPKVNNNLKNKNLESTRKNNSTYNKFNKQSNLQNKNKFNKNENKPDLIKAKNNQNNQNKKHSKYIHKQIQINNNVESKSNKPKLTYKQFLSNINAKITQNQTDNKVTTANIKTKDNKKQINQKPQKTNINIKNNNNQLTSVNYNNNSNNFDKLNTTQNNNKTKNVFNNKQKNKNNVKQKAQKNLPNGNVTNKQNLLTNNNLKNKANIPSNSNRNNKTNTNLNSNMNSKLNTHINNKFKKNNTVYNDTLNQIETKFTKNNKIQKQTNIDKHTNNLKTINIKNQNNLKTKKQKNQTNSKIDTNKLNNFKKNNSTLKLPTTKQTPKVNLINNKKSNIKSINKNEKIVTKKNITLKSNIKNQTSIKSNKNILNKLKQVNSNSIVKSKSIKNIKYNKNNKLVNVTKLELNNSKKLNKPKTTNIKKNIKSIKQPKVNQKYKLINIKIPKTQTYNLKNIKQQNKKLFNNSMTIKQQIQNCITKISNRQYVGTDSLLSQYIQLRKNINSKSHKILKSLQKIQNQWPTDPAAQIQQTPPTTTTLKNKKNKFKKIPTIIFKIKRRKLKDTLKNNQLYYKINKEPKEILHLMNTISSFQINNKYYKHTNILGNNFNNYIKFTLTPKQRQLRAEAMQHTLSWVKKKKINKKLLKFKFLKLKKKKIIKQKYTPEARVCWKQTKNKLKKKFNTKTKLHFSNQFKYIYKNLDKFKTLFTRINNKNFFHILNSKLLKPKINDKAVALLPNKLSIIKPTRLDTRLTHLDFFISTLWSFTKTKQKKKKIYKKKKLTSSRRTSQYLFNKKTVVTPKDLLKPNTKDIKKKIYNLILQIKNNKNVVTSIYIIKKTHNKLEEKKKNTLILTNLKYPYYKTLKTLFFKNTIINNIRHNISLNSFKSKLTIKRYKTVLNQNPHNLNYKLLIHLNQSLKNFNNRKKKKKSIYKSLIKNINNKLKNTSLKKVKQYCELHKLLNRKNSNTIYMRSLELIYTRDKKKFDLGEKIYHRFFRKTQINFNLRMNKKIRTLSYLVKQLKKSKKIKKKKWKKIKRKWLSSRKFILKQRYILKQQINLISKYNSLHNIPIKLIHFNIRNYLFLNKPAFESSILNFYFKTISPKLKLTKEFKKTLFFNFRNKKLTTYRNARRLHWSTHTHKRLNKRKYSNFITKWVKNTNKYWSTFKTHCMFKFNFSHKFWESFIALYRFVYNKALEFKTISQLPIHTTFWWFLNLQKKILQKVSLKINFWQEKKNKIKKTFWMEQKKNLPKFIKKKLFRLYKSLSSIHYDYITNSFIMLKELKQPIHNNLYFINNKLLKLHNFKYNS